MNIGADALLRGDVCKRPLPILVIEPCVVTKVEDERDWSTKQVEQRNEVYCPQRCAKGNPYVVTLLNLDRQRKARPVDTDTIDPERVEAINPDITGPGISHRLHDG